MSIHSIINDEVKSVLRENDQKKVVSLLSQIFSDPSIELPKTEKFVLSQVSKLIKSAQKSSIQKEAWIVEADDDEEDLESLRLDPEDPQGKPTNDVAAQVRAGRNKALGIGGAVVKGAVGDIGVGGGRVLATVISKLPGGTRWGAPLLGAIFDSTTNKAAKNFAIFAVANFFAGMQGIDVIPLLGADLGDAIQHVNGWNWDMIDVVDDVVLLKMALTTLKKTGTDLQKAKERFLSFAQGEESPEEAEARRQKLGLKPTDPPKFQTTTGKKQQQESIMKKSALMKIIREEVEVVLTNKEASEIFDLDLDRLNEISRPSFREMWNLLSQWIEDQGVHEKSPEYDQMEKEFLTQHGWDQGKFDAAADIARGSGDIAFLEEAWKGDPEVNQTGEYADKTKDELCAMKKSLMGKESRTEPEQKKVRQINFALRSKQKGPKFGKVGC